jgi:hypothetical protein
MLFDDGLGCFAIAIEVWRCHTRLKFAHRLFFFGNPRLEVQHTPIASVGSLPLPAGLRVGPFSRVPIGSPGTRGV